MSLLDSLIEAAVSDQPLVQEREYSAVIATCWITPIKCLACGDIFRNAEVTFTAVRKGTGQRVLLQNHDPAAFLAQHPSATRRIETREEEGIPFCSCSKEKNEQAIPSAPTSQESTG